MKNITLEEAVAITNLIGSLPTEQKPTSFGPSSGSRWSRSLRRRTRRISTSDPYRPLAVLALAVCFGTAPCPVSPGTALPIEPARAGAVVANFGTAEGMAQEIASTGVSHLRLSAYYREPWSLQRTIREAWEAHEAGLTLLVDVQTYPRNGADDPPALAEWMAAWDTLARDLPPGAVLSMGNEVNAGIWWPWSEDLLDQFWAEAHTIAHAHGRTFAGPHLAGDYPTPTESLRWLSRFLSRNPAPDILTVHYYGPGLHDWIARVPFGGTVWLAETGGTIPYLENALRAPRVERVYLFTWAPGDLYTIDTDWLHRILNREDQ